MRFKKKIITKHLFFLKNQFSDFRLGFDLNGKIYEYRTY